VGNGVNSKRGHKHPARERHEKNTRGREKKTEETWEVQRVHRRKKKEGKHGGRRSGKGSSSPREGKENPSRTG